MLLPIHQSFGKGTGYSPGQTVPEDYINQYAENMLKDGKAVENMVDRAVDLKLIAALKQVVKLEEKSISLDDFDKMMQEK